MTQPASPTDAAAVARSRPWRLAVGLTLAAVAFGFYPVLAELVHLWTSKADYSHGLLVVPFVGYLLYRRRDLIPATIQWPKPVGVLPLLLSAAILVAADRVNIAKEWSQGFALVLALAGVVVLYGGGLKALHWAWPGLVFLLFALQLPHSIEQRLSVKLQAFATDAGNFAFQTIGLASYTRGNIIVIGDTTLGVDRACSGLSMLLAFVTLAAAIAVLYRDRPVIDRVLILASSVPIALVCNVLRIVVTGLVYHAGWTRLGDAIVHDLAGWLMMPLALGMLWGELKLLDFLVEPVDSLSASEALGLPVRRPAAAKS